MYVIGTAGHVDHGKTRLIEALTGIDADRLPEEKRRGLTIDLGFAHFAAPGGSPVGVIDVPGHERFIRNMVAGAWSLCCGILTVAADDGWMQQSTDHTRVLEAMGVPRLIVAVTKIDAVPAERVAQVLEEVQPRCAGLGYPQAPSIPVSAATGENIEALRSLILAELDGLGGLPDCRGTPGRPGIASPAHRAVASPFVYIDRAFTVRGAGVVITGSLTGGELARDTELELLPQRRRVRVRSIQAYYQDRERVQPVCRVALNLAGIRGEEIARGNALSAPGASVWTERELIVRVPPAEPGQEEELRRAIRRHGEVEMAVGTGHYRVRLRSLEASGAVHVAADEAIPLRWNEPLVFIRHGGSSILGSGRLVWPGTTSRIDRRRISELFGSAAGTGREAGSPVPMSLPRLRLGMKGYLRASELTEGDAAGMNTVRREGWVLFADTLRELEESIRALAASAGGLPVSELASRFRMDQEMLVAVCTDLVRREELSLRAGVLLPRGGAETSLSPMGRQLLTDLRAAGAAGLQLDRLKALGSAKELRTLARGGLAVSLDANIYYDRDTYAELTGRILEGLAPGDRLPIPEAKARSGLTRKYIIPLLNRMEADGWVRRDGDERVVTRVPGGESGARPSGTQSG
jgi:selenocysteine-specific elongation factor